MIYDLIMSLRYGANPRDVVPGVLFTIIVVLFSLTMHEFSHGYMAYKLGDKTARNFGRLTLAPHKHLDPVGTICMLLFGFGWAKPVPVNSRYFKKPRRDMALTALAGPLSNIFLSFISVFFLILIFRFNTTAYEFYRNGFAGDTILAASALDKIVSLLAMLFYYGHYLNLSLAVFNLIPLPPLDGSRILFIFLPANIYFGMMKYERFISIAVFVLLWSGFLSGIMSFFVNLISSGMINLIYLIPGL